jgi:O-antigen/teichoic acid export membrane protein
MPRGFGLARRFAFGLAGEGMQSAFHFLVNLALMRVLPPSEYGLFAIVFTLGSLGLTYASALVATPATILIPRCRNRGTAELHDVMLGSVALALALAAALLVGVGLVAWSGDPAVAALGGLFVGLWALRAYVRAALYARRDAARVAGSDLAFAASGVTLGLSLAFVGIGSDAGRLAAAFGVLAGANLAGIAAAFTGSGRRVRVSARRAIRRRYRRHWPMLSWSLVGVTTSNVQSQFQTFLVAALAGPAAFAPIAAATILLAPLRLAVGALIAMVQPDFAAALAEGRIDRVRALLAGSFALVLAACLGYGAALWLGFDLLRAHLFGASFGGEPMGLITCLAWAIALGYLSYMLPKALIEAAGGFRLVATATLASAVVGIVCVSALLVTTSPAWSLAGVVAAEFVTLVCFWIQAARILGRSPRPMPVAG